MIEYRITAHNSIQLNMLEDEVIILQRADSSSRLIGEVDISDTGPAEFYGSAGGGRDLVGDDSLSYSSSPLWRLASCACCHGHTVLPKTTPPATPHPTNQ